MSESQSEGEQPPPQQGDRVTYLVEYAAGEQLRDLQVDGVGYQLDETTLRVIDLADDGREVTAVEVNTTNFIAIREVA